VFFYTWRYREHYKCAALSPYITSE
jgi:hypothetical protein